MAARDRKSTRLNSSHTVIYTLSLHDALLDLVRRCALGIVVRGEARLRQGQRRYLEVIEDALNGGPRSEEHTSELQSHSDLHSFPTRRSSRSRPPLRARDRSPGRSATPPGAASLPRSDRRCAEWRP